LHFSRTEEANAANAAKANNKANNFKANENATRTPKTQPRHHHHQHHYQLGRSIIIIITFQSSTSVERQRVTWAG